MIRPDEGRDGRKLSHAKLEEIRFAAVKAVQAGQSPSAVARAMGLYSNRIIRMACGLSIGWLGCTAFA